MRTSTCRRLAASALILAAMTGCATSPVTTGTRAEAPFPSPLSGPGHPRADDAVRRHVDRGWRELLAGRFDAAQRETSKAGENPAATLLGLQVQVMEEPENALEGLRKLVASQPQYASAWITLSVAAEKTGEEAEALTAARKSAELWGSQRWLQRVARLEDRWIGSRLAAAREALDTGDWSKAATLAGAARSVDPKNRRATLLLARAQMGMGNDQAALDELAALRGDPDAIILQARIAEHRKEWTRALELYQGLPSTDPRRKPALERVKRRWRIANLPDHVQAALHSAALTRNELAILTVNLLPELMALPPRNVPVISDIVDLPSQREIVTMVSAGLMRADPIEHTFDPQGRIGAARVREILDRAMEATGHTPPRWCPGPSPEKGCFALSDPPTGQEVADVLIAMEEVPPHE